MKSKQESFTRRQAAEINYILTEEREVAVLENRHLPKRLQASKHKMSGAEATNGGVTKHHLYHFE